MDLYFIIWLIPILANTPTYLTLKFKGLVYIKADVYNSLDALYHQVLESYQFNVIVKLLTICYFELIFRYFFSVILFTQSLQT